jgi:hypothetical protein
MDRIQSKGSLIRILVQIAPPEIVYYYLANSAFNKVKGLEKLNFFL